MYYKKENADRICDFARKTETEVADDVRQRALTRLVPDWKWFIVTNSGPNGEADYTDNRYWLKTAKVNNPDDTVETLSFEAMNQYDPEYQHITATNLAEYVRQSHLLEVGTVVDVRILQSQYEKISHNFFSFLPNEILAYIGGFFDSVESQELSSCVASWGCGGWQTYNSSPTPDTAWFGKSLCWYDCGNGPELYCASNGGIGIGDPPAGGQNLAKWDATNGKWVTQNYVAWAAINTLCVYEDVTATVMLRNEDDSANAIQCDAIRPGTWANGNVAVVVKSLGNGRYRLEVIYNGPVVEAFHDLEFKDQNSPRYIIDIVNGQSNYIRLTAQGVETTLKAKAYGLTGGVNGYLYCGGDSLAKYDGSSFSAVGTPPDGPVYGLFKFNNLLYVGGSFANAGGTTKNSVCSWNGSAYAALDGGVGNYSETSYGQVNCFCSFDDDLDGTESLFLGGIFYKADGTIVCNNVAKWNGSSFSAVNDGIGNGSQEIFCLAKYEDVNGSINLFAGANGAVYKNYLSTWKAITDAISGQFYSMVQYGNKLVIGGTTPYGILDPHFESGSSGVVYYDTGTMKWVKIGRNLNAAVYACIIYDGKLIVGGAFTNPNKYIAQYDTASENWTSYGLGTYDKKVRCLIDFNNTLIAGGDFQDHIKDTATGLPLGPACNGNVHCFHKSGGQLYIGGAFTQIGSALNAGGFAMYDGTTFHTWDNGVNNSDGQRKINAICVFGGVVYIGGLFDTAGGTAAKNIAKWNSGTQQWEAVTAGGIDGEVLTMTVLGSDLIIGGTFATVNSGGIAANNIVKTDGTTYTAMDDRDDSVRASYIWNGDLYIDSPDDATIYNRLVVWDGANFDDFADEIAGEILCITNGIFLGDDKLICSGGIVATGYQNTYTGYAPCDNIIAYDGIQVKKWTGGIGSGFLPILGVGSAHVRSLIVDWYGTLYATGDGSPASNKVAECIAKLTYRGIEPVGIGVRGGDYSVLAFVRYKGGLVLGGSFTYAINLPDPITGVANDADYISASNIAYWNNAEYSAMSTGLDGRVKGLTLGVVGGNTVVTAVGWFTDGTAYWDDFTDPLVPVWVIMPGIQTASSDTVDCIYFGGYLFACGNIDLDGGGAETVVCYGDMSSGSISYSDASPLSSSKGMAGVRFVIADVDGAGDKLYMAVSCNDSSFTCVYVWDGVSSFGPVDTRMTTGAPLDITMVPGNADNGNKDTLWVCGGFVIDGVDWTLAYYNDVTAQWVGVELFGGLNQMQSIRGLRYGRKLLTGGDYAGSDTDYHTFLSLYNNDDNTFYGWLNNFGANWIVLRFG